MDNQNETHEPQLHALINDQWVKVETVLGKLAFDNKGDDMVNDLFTGDYPAEIYVVQTENGMELTEEFEMR